MEDKLVTLAIHTYAKAQILKTILETEGIEVYIHNVNQIQPVISAGVRVRIKERDLPHALRVIEDSKWFDKEKDKKPEEPHRLRVLIPVDFSDYSLKACEIGINYAHKRDADVMIMHAYFSPFFPTAAPLGNSMVYQLKEEENLEFLRNKVVTDMDGICKTLRAKMASGELPEHDFDYTLREGLPEEEIIAFGKEYRPDIIIMGTRGKDRKEADLIGSVTGEVIELNRVPVLAIPEDVPFTDLEVVKNVAFATSFNERDLLVFDAFMEVFSGYGINIHLFNISTSRNDWNEIRLAGAKEYFKKQYPDASISYTVLADGDLLLAIEKFVRDKQIDIIAFSTYRRNILARMFNPSLARRMLFHTNTPLLVMHAKN